MKAVRPQSGSGLPAIGPGLRCAASGLRATLAVIPANAGIQRPTAILDTRFRGYDDHKYENLPRMGIRPSLS
jgi:hypothetical protein